MNMRLLGLVLISVFAANTAWPVPAEVILIRHAEKPASGHDLTPKGEKRARALVHYFKMNPNVTKFGTPVAIYAAAPNGGSKRPVETVTPLAKSLGIEIDEDFGKYDTDEVAKDILKNPDYDGKMVLLCWEHKRIPDIADALGAEDAPDSWPDTVYDRVWILDFKGHQVHSFKNISQHLLPGDTEN